MATNSHSLLFNGSTQHGAVASPTELFGLTALTAEFWFYPVAAASGKWLFSVGTVAAGAQISYQFNLQDTPVKMRARCAVGSTIAGLTGSTTITTGKWWHCAMTYDGANVRLYLGDTTTDDASEGTPAALTGTLNTPNTSNDSAFIGAIGLTNETDIGNWSNVYIDELRVWNTAQSLATINANKTKQITSDPNLVGYWSMNNGSGSTATDSVNSNNFTLTNSPTWSTTVPFTTYTLPSGGDSNMFLAM